MDRRKWKKAYAIVYALLCVNFWAGMVVEYLSFEGQSGSDYLGWFLLAGVSPFIAAMQVAFYFSTAYLIFETQKTRAKTILYTVMLIACGGIVGYPWIQPVLPWLLLFR